MRKVAEYGIVENVTGVSSPRGGLRCTQKAPRNSRSSTPCADARGSARLRAILSHCGARAAAPIVFRHAARVLQLDDEYRASFLRVFHTDTPPVHLDDLLDDRQPDARG